MLRKIFEISDETMKNAISVRFYLIGDLIGSYTRYDYQDNGEFYDAVHNCIYDLARIEQTFPSKIDIELFFPE